MRQSVFRPFVPYFAAAALWANVGFAQAVPAAAPAPSIANGAMVAAESGSPALDSNPAYDRGVAELEAGHFAEAVSALNDAYSTDGNAIALLKLATAYERQGQLTLAVETYARFVARADAMRDADSITEAQAQIQKLRSDNGVIVVQVVPATAMIGVDGVTMSPVNGELIVAPGQRRFEIRAEGFVSYDQKMAVAPGKFSLDVALTHVSQVTVQAPVAVAPAQDSVLSDAEAADEPEADDVMDCALSSVCMGPVLALIGPPNLIGGGLHFRLGEYFGAGVDYQGLPSISFDPVSVSSSLFSVNARVYPFAGAFFLGGGFAYQSVRGELSTQDVTVAARASFPAAMASIGFMGRDGFVLGMDLGVMFPLGSRSVEIEQMEVRAEFQGMTVPQSDIDDAREEVQSQVSKVVDAMPVFLQLNLIRIGYLF